MFARGLLALLVAVTLGTAAPSPARAEERAYVELLIQYYADFYGLPLELVRRVVNRESTFNPRARNGPYWGLMQIRHDTAQTMGYRGSAEGLLDAETNLIYAVKYLRGAYLVARGNQDRAVMNYARGYYYDARDMGLLEETGLRPGPNNPPTAPRPGAAAGAVAVAAAPPVVLPAPTPAPAPQTENAPAPVATLQPTAPVQAVALGFAPPARPATLEDTPPALAAAAAVAGASEVAETPAEPDEQALATLSRGLEAVSAYAARGSAETVADTDVLRGTFSLLDAVTGFWEASELPAGAEGFIPPERPAGL